MFRFFSRQRQKHKIKKVKEGDGHLLKPYRIWDIFMRSVFYAQFRNNAGEKTVYTIVCKYWVEDYTAELYKDNRHIATSKLPAVFPVIGGVIEVGLGSYGLNRMHYIDEEGVSYRLQPDPRSLRGLRMRFDKSFPQTSRFIGIIAIVILLFSLALGLPQIAETLSQIPWIEENIGTFTSPVTLSFWTNIAIGSLAAISGIERSLMLRKHWLIDIETGSWDS